MGGGVDKGCSIYKTLIRFPVSVGCQRLLLMQRCNGMWIMRHYGVEPVPTLWKWTRQRGFLPATSNSWESRSWLSIMKTHPILTGFPFYSVIDDSADVTRQRNKHSKRWWRLRGEKIKEKVWSVVFPRELHYIWLWFQTLVDSMEISPVLLPWVTNGQAGMKLKSLDRI